MENKPFLGQGFPGLSLASMFLFLRFVYCIISCSFSLFTDFF